MGMAGAKWWMKVGGEYLVPRFVVDGVCLLTRK